MSRSAPKPATKPGPKPGPKPSYVREYENLLRRLRREEPDEARVMARMVGDHYEEMGRAHRRLLEAHGLAPGARLADIGCGSGRTAYALRDIEGLDYLGTDIVPDLLDFARTKTGRADWRFELITDLVIPAADGWADFALFLSVFTHLTPSQSLIYLREAARILKPGGLVVFSYLDRDAPAQRAAYPSRWRQWLARRLGLDVRNQFVCRSDVDGWLGATALEEIKRYDGAEAAQHVVVARKPAP